MGSTSVLAFLVALAPALGRLGIETKDSLGMLRLDATVETALHVILAFHLEVATCSIPDPLETIFRAGWYHVLRSLVVSDILCQRPEILHLPEVPELQKIIGGNGIKLA